MALRWTTPPVATTRLTELLSQRAPTQEREPPSGPSIGDPKSQAINAELLEVVEPAVLVRAVTATRRGEAALRALGFKVMKISRSDTIVPKRKSLDDQVA